MSDDHAQLVRLFPTGGQSRLLHRSGREVARERASPSSVPRAESPQTLTPLTEKSDCIPFGLADREPDLHPPPS